MAQQLHLVDDTALRDDPRLARTVLRQPCSASRHDRRKDSASSTVALIDARVVDINRARAAAGLSHEELCRRASAGTRNWFRLLRGEQAPTASLIVRLTRAVSQEKPQPKPRSVIAAFHRLVMMALAQAQGVDAAAVLAADFTVQRPTNKDWLAAARLRAFAIYITAVELEVDNVDLAAALGCSREAIRKARNKVEDQREDPAIDALLDTIAQQVRG